MQNDHEIQLITCHECGRKLKGRRGQAGHKKAHTRMKKPEFGTISVPINEYKRMKSALEMNDNINKVLKSNGVVAFWIENGKVRMEIWDRESVIKARRRF